MTDKQIISNTLRWCNKIRKKKDMEPIKELPKGTPGDGKTCPCGKVTGLTVGIYSAYDNQGDEVREIPTTESVKLFTNKFDRYEFPDLIEDGHGLK